MSNYGEPWSLVDLDDHYSEVYGTGFKPDIGKVERSVGDRITAAVNACAGLNPAGIPKLVAAVAKIVAACQEAKREGWEDYTNFSTTLEVALEGCYDEGVTSQEPKHGGDKIQT